MKHTLSLNINADLETLKKVLAAILQQDQESFGDQQTFNIDGVETQVDLNEILAAVAAL